MCNRDKVRPFPRVLAYFGWDRSRDDFDKRKWFACGNEEVPKQLKFKASALSEVHLDGWFERGDGTVWRRTNVGKDVNAHCPATGCWRRVDEDTAERTAVNVLGESPFKTATGESLEMFARVQNDELDGFVRDFGRGGCVLVSIPQDPKLSKWVVSTCLKLKT